MASPPALLKKLDEELAPGLTTLFQPSLASGIVPEEWTHAPIYEKGEQTIS